MSELKDKWDKHKISSIMIRDILMYMVCPGMSSSHATVARSAVQHGLTLALPWPQDRTYVVAQKKVAVYERGLHIFRDEVVRNPRVKDRLLEMLLNLVAREVRPPWQLALARARSRFAPPMRTSRTVLAPAARWRDDPARADQDDYGHADGAGARRVQPRL